MVKFKWFSIKLRIAGKQTNRRRPPSIVEIRNLEMKNVRPNSCNFVVNHRFQEPIYNELSV